MTDTMTRRNRLRQMLKWSAYSLLLVLLLPLLPYAIDAATNATGNKAAAEFIKVPNPGGELWRDVRQRDRTVTGSTQVKGVDSDVLINKGGEDWRQFRMKTLVPFGYILLLTVIALILLFHYTQGPMRLPNGFSGKNILRFTLSERVVHWVTVGLFWILGLTGLILLYGRFVLIPVLGAQGFSYTATACKVLHNYAGPFFLFALIVMFITFFKDNFLNKGDLKWIAKAGGLFGGHASAGRFNAGEKSWFWIVTILGFTLCITGLILDFPLFGQGRETMALSYLIHGLVAFIILAVSLGHAYLGIAGMEGSLSSMTKGHVDENWARLHHDQWYEEIKNKAPDSRTAPGGVATGGLAEPRRDKL